MGTYTVTFCCECCGGVCSPPPPPPPPPPGVCGPTYGEKQGCITCCQQGYVDPLHPSPAAYTYTGSGLAHIYETWIGLCGGVGAHINCATSLFSFDTAAACQYVWDGDHADWLALCQAACDASCLSDAGANCTAICENYWTSLYNIYIDPADAGGDWQAVTQGLACYALDHYGRTVAPLPGVFADLLNGDVTLTWDPLLEGDDDWRPRYTAHFTRTVDGTPYTLDFVYECHGSMEGLGAASCYWDLVVTSSDGGSYTWYDAGAHQICLASGDAGCVGFVIDYSPSGSTTLPDPFPDDLYMHWSSYVLGNGQWMYMDPCAHWQNCVPSNLPNPIVLHKLNPYVPIWESDCIPFCMARDSFTEPAQYPPADVPREPAVCYAKFRIVCTADGPNSKWFIQGPGYQSGDPSDPTNGPTNGEVVMFTTLSIDPYEIRLDKLPSYAGVVTGSGSATGDCAHNGDPGYVSDCAAFHDDAANPVCDPGDTADPLHFRLLGLMILEV